MELHDFHRQHGTVLEQRTVIVSKANAWELDRERQDGYVSDRFHSVHVRMAADQLGNTPIDLELIRRMLHAFAATIGPATVAYQHCQDCGFEAHHRASCPQAAGLKTRTLYEHGHIR